MYRDHRLGSGAVWPVGKRVTQHLIGGCIDRWLVKQHQIGRMARQGLNRKLPKVARHAAGQGLEGRQWQTRPFVQDTTAKKPANTRTEKWSKFLGPALVWTRGDLVHGRTPEPIGRCGSRYVYPGQVGTNAGLTMQPQRLQIIRLAERHQGDDGASWAIHCVAMGL